MTTINVSLEQAIRSIAREAETLTREALTPLGVTPLQYDILEAVSRYMEDPDEYALLPIRISRAVQVGRKTGSREILILKTKGHIRTAPGGSRLLTAQGIETLKDCRAATRFIDKYVTDSYFKNLSLEEITEAYATQQERARSK